MISLLFLAVTAIASLISDALNSVVQFQVIFVLVGGFTLFAFAYSSPFIIRALNLVNSRIIGRSRDDKAVRFFFWCGIISLPLFILDAVFSLSTKNLFFGVAVSVGLISGCSHVLAVRNE